jgi:lysophospholipase L1-like esterase
MVVVLVILETAAYLYYRYALLNDFMALDISDSFHNVPDLFELRHTDKGDVLFSRYFPTRYYVSDRNYRGKTMAATKTSKIFRVFSFGGSSTAGSPWGHEGSFSRFLEDELNALKRNGTTVEVLNFGGGGYGSTRALGLVNISIKYKPDLILIYSGDNEMWDNDIYLDLSKDEMKSRVRRYGDQFYIVRVARKLLERKLAKPPERINLLRSNGMYIPRIIQENKGFKAPDRRYLLAQYKQNMLDIIRVAHANNIQVLLVSQSSNFFFEPSWYPGVRDQEQVRIVAELLAAYKLNNFEVARARAADVLKLNIENPVAHFYLGLIDKMAGNYNSAREHLLMAIDCDEKPERFTRAQRSMLQGLENHSAGVYFVDVWKTMIDFLDDGIVDGRLYIDKMHPTIEGNKLIARTIETDFFARHRVRPDLFDYNKMDPNRIWKTSLSPDFYLKICDRYYNVTDPALCVPDMPKRYTEISAASPEKGIYRNSWEYLLYYGLLTNDTTWFDKSATIYRGLSLEAVRSQMPVAKKAP